MTTADEIVGPVPSGQEPDEYDKLRRRVLWSIPYGLFVTGSRAGDRLNAMTVNLVTQVALNPKLIGMAVVKTALTHELIHEGRVFSLCFIDREDRALVRKFTKPVEVDIAARTLNEIPYHEGTTGAPIIDQAAAYVECELRNEVDTGDHTLFIGEVVNAAFQSSEETSILRMEDTRMNYGG